MVSFTPQLPYPLRKNLWYKLDKEVSESESWSGYSGKEKEFPAPASNQIPAIHPTAYISHSTKWVFLEYSYHVKYFI